jgi:putative two-component system response regulator
MDEIDVFDARILIVDDHDANSELLRQILAGAGYLDISTTRYAEEVPRICNLQPRPELLLLDLHMPGMSGYEVMGELRPILLGPPYMRVLVVTADVTQDAKRHALMLGASDFLTKPVDVVELLLRVGNVLRSCRLQHNLNALVAERTQALERTRIDVLARLARAAEYRDDTTGRHTKRVGHTAALLAAAIELPAHTVELIRIAAPLHDVGKIAIPDEILLKPGRLTDEEQATMRTHVEIGADILSDGESDELQLAHGIALYHHERWEGNGYGKGLAGAEIPIAARLTAVADNFDALTHKRPYKDAWPLDQAVAEITAQSGRSFDPDIVNAFIQLDHATLADHPESQLSSPTNVEHRARIASVPGRAERTATPDHEIAAIAIASTR